MGVDTATSLPEDTFCVLKYETGIAVTTSARLALTPYFLKGLGQNACGQARRFPVDNIPLNPAKCPVRFANNHVVLPKEDT